MGEFELIERYFKRPARGALLGVGDDCALVAATPGMQTAITTDMLVEGRHFFAGADPFRLGWKCLAVNLSDLAAMGATPKFFTLSFALAQANEQWLEPFAQGIFTLADAHHIELIGGDTTKGPLTISITAIGEVPPTLALRRDGARVGDDIWLSNEVGGAALRLFECWGKTTIADHERERFMLRMEKPEPRVQLGQKLRGIATSAIDISDGLTGDLQHILRASKVGATIHTPHIATAPILKSRLQIPSERALALHCTLAGGDDYELCFTAPKSKRTVIEEILKTLSLNGGVFGEITDSKSLTILDETGATLPMPNSFDHFLE